MSSEYDPAANRRRFLQYLAASPLMAAGSGSVASTLASGRVMDNPWAASICRAEATFTTCYFRAKWVAA